MDVYYPEVHQSECGIGDPRCVPQYRHHCDCTFAHLLEASLFAVFYRYVGAFNDWNTSFYFSLVSYATVGYGDVTLPEHWRLIGGVEGLVGALMVGWSVAVLVAVLQRLRGMSQ